MRRFFLLSLAAFFILGINVALAEPVIPDLLKESPNISILPFKNKATVPDAFKRKIALNDASIVSDFLLARLWETGRFKVIDREILSEAIEELQFSQSGLVSSVAALSAGKQLGVKYMVMGSVNNISYKDTPVSLMKGGTGGVKFSKVTITANISLRFVDVETGEIVLAVDGTGESSRGDAELGINKKYYETSNISGDVGDVHIDITSQTEKNSGYSIKVGSNEVSQIQIRNALYKATIDAVENPKFGILALIDGSTQKRKV